MAEEKKQELSVSAPIVRGADFRHVYSQAYRIRLHPNEATITFSLASDRPSEAGGLPEQVLQEEVAVTAHYWGMKALALELGAMIAEIEKIHGPVPLTPAIEANIRNIVNIVHNVHGKPKTADEPEKKADD